MISKNLLQPRTPVFTVSTKDKYYPSLCQVEDSHTCHDIQDPRES